MSETENNLEKKKSHSTNLDSIFKIDERHANDGVLFDVGNGVKFHLRHFSSQNPEGRKALAKYFKPYAKQIELGTLSQDKVREINIDMFFDVCLVNWYGITDENGKEIPCNREESHKLFNRLPILFQTLQDYANDFNNYKEDLGNS